MVLPCIRFIHKGGMLVGVKAFYEKRRCMMVDRQVVAVEVLECSDERVSGEEMRSSDYKLTNGVFFVDRCNLKLEGRISHQPRPRINLETVYKVYTHK